MQKHANNGVTLHCDFCGSLWDMEKSMIEGHRGSVLCLDCLDQAIREAKPAETKFTCTLCLREYDPGQESVWKPADPPADANPQAALCLDCVQQADRAFDRDPDTDWTRKMAPTKRWR